MGRELATGLGALLLALAYYVAADNIPRSLLSDAVGADGVPKVLGLVLGLLGVIQIARASFRPAAAGGDAAEAGETRRHLRALGLIAFGAIYVAAAPVLGYLLATGLLILVVAAYAGMALSARLVATAALGSLTLWLVFAKLLGVGMPKGFWPELLARTLG